MYSVFENEVEMITFSVDAELYVFSKMVWKLAKRWCYENWMKASEAALFARLMTLISVHIVSGSPNQQL